MLRLVLICLLALLPTTAHAVTLNVLEWEDYISPFADDFQAWAREEKGIDVTLVFIRPYATNPEQFYRAVRSEQADVVTPTHNYYKMHNAKLARALLPLDVNRLRHYNDVLEMLRTADFDELDGRKYSIPLLGGSYGLAYNNSLADQPSSWKVLWDPANKGTYSITSEQFEANVYLCMLMAGYSPQDYYDIDTTNFQRAKVQGYLNTLVVNAHSFWAGMAQPEVMKSLKYTTTYWFGVSVANRQGQDWRLASPSEGQTLWLDTMALSHHLKDDPEKREAAYLLLDFMISPEIQKRIHEHFGSVIVNTKAAAEVSPGHVADWWGGGDLVFQEEWFWRPLTARTRNMYKLMWQEAMKVRSNQHGVLPVN